MSGSAAPSVEDLRTSFLHPNITPINGEPHFEEIQRVHALLKSNAASVASALGGGAHGLLGLVTTPATYLRITGAAFNIPANPGITPTIPPGATAAQIGALTRQHTSDLRAYQETI